MSAIDLIRLFVGGAVFGFFLFPFVTIYLPSNRDRRRGR